MRRTKKTEKTTLKELRKLCASNFRAWEAIMRYLEPAKDRLPVYKPIKTIWVGKASISGNKNASLCCTPFGNIWAWEPSHRPRDFAKYTLSRGKR